MNWHIYLFAKMLRPRNFENTYVDHLVGELVVYLSLSAALAAKWGQVRELQNKTPKENNTSLGMPLGVCSQPFFIQILKCYGNPLLYDVGGAKARNSVALGNTF